MCGVGSRRVALPQDIVASFEADHRRPDKEHVDGLNKTGTTNIRLRAKRTNQAFHNGLASFLNNIWSYLNAIFPWKEDGNKLMTPIAGMEFTTGEPHLGAIRDPVSNGSEQLRGARKQHRWLPILLRDTYGSQ
jgi:hypothetical protein